MRGVMNLPRRHFLHLTAAAVAANLPRRALADDYPSRPVRIVAGFAAGGGVDVTARLIGQWLDRGQGPALSDLLGGQVEVLFAATPGTADFIASGRLRALAVTTAARAAVLPQLPPVGETVPGYEASQWYGLSAPKSTPADIVATLNREINGALADKDMLARLAAIGGEPLPGTPAAFAALIADET